MIGLEVWEYFRKIRLFPSEQRNLRSMNVLGVVGVRERGRRLLAEMQARNNED